MADPGARELKLTQYLNEAYGKEKQLETTLQAQIGLAKAAGRKPLQKRLQDHLKETKAQSRGLERRIKQLGGKAQAVDLPGPDIASEAASGVANVANRALAAAKGPVQALRGTSQADNLLRNMRDAFWNEAEEIAHYNVIEAAANNLGDKDTAKLAKDHRRQEERMQSFLAKQIEQLVKAVIREEIPASERKPATAASSRGRSSSRSASSSRSSGSRSSKSGSGSGSSSRAKSSGSSSRAKSASGSSKSSGSSTRAKSSGSSSRAKSSSGASKSSGASTRAKSSGSSSRSKSSGSSNGKSGSSRSKARSGSGSS